MFSRSRNGLRSVWIAVIIAAAFALLGGACEREKRGFRVEAPSASRIDAKRLTDFQPGTPTANPLVRNQYEGNAYALSEGKRLFSSMNCVGCHAHGGGSIGPPLMDDKWIYGGRPEQVFSTIVEGRPNGMPSFRGKLPDYQVWQLAAYVRSMSGQVPADAAPSRDDDMKVVPPENSRPPERIKSGGLPRSAEAPQ